jgi:hypothetical protein
LTIGPSVDSGPGTNGTAIVVDGVGANCPRIQIEISPVPGAHAVPVLTTSFRDSKAAMATPAGTVACR